MTLERSSNPILNPAPTGGDSVGLTLGRSPGATDIQLQKRKKAGSVIGELAHDLERYILSKGQFSQIDVILNLMDQTGPADLAISTWSAASDDLVQLRERFADGRIRSLRFLLDHTFQRRKPHICGQLRKFFGDESIRIFKNHAKIVVISNDEWKINLLTSANLNLNPRTEFMILRESEELAEFHLDWFDEIFETRKAWTQFEQTHAHHEHAFERI